MEFAKIDLEKTMGPKKISKFINSKNISKFIKHIQIYQFKKKFQSKQHEIYLEQDVDCFRKKTKCPDLRIGTQEHEVN